MPASLTEETIPKQAPSRASRKALAIPLLATGIFICLGMVSHARTNARLAWTFGGAAIFLLCWQAALWLMARRSGRGFEWEFVPIRSHWMQASVQFTVYVYWGWYWRNVYAEAPLIFSQVAFLYTFDALLTWSRGQKWRIGFGPWPIVFSTNLFMWFRDDWFIFQFLMVATGVLGKHFIRWKRDGKITHIFNPSAFALTLFSLGLIFTSTSGNTWGSEIATTQGLPPHIYLEIFLGGLVLQYFFAVTLLTFSAAATLAALSILYTQITGVYVFFDSNIPIAIFLGLHLLMTDPATTPRSGLGKFIFGSLYGASVFGLFILLDAMGIPSFYDKLLVVPVLNLFTPALDRLAGLGWAGKLGRWEIAVGTRKTNLGVMACWLGIFLAMLSTGFVDAPHPGATIAFWKRAAEQKRPYAAKRLAYLLNKFTSADLDDVTKSAEVMGDARQSRAQALGILCNQVALIYAEGKLVPANPDLAARYFAKACEFGNTEACANVAGLFLSQNKIKFSDQQAAQALSKLESTCLDSTNGRGAFIVGYSYETGRGHPVDKAAARKFYEQSATRGELDAWRQLGRMESDGEGGPADYVSAAKWLQKAAERHDGPSCLYLARLYHKGLGVPVDEQRATALLQEACERGVEPACLLLRQGKQP